MTIRSQLPNRKCLTPLAPLIRGELIVPLRRGIEGVALSVFTDNHKTASLLSQRSLLNIAKTVLPQN